MSVRPNYEKRVFTEGGHCEDIEDNSYLSHNLAWVQSHPGPVQGASQCSG